MGALTPRQASLCNFNSRSSGAAEEWYKQLKRTNGTGGYHLVQPACSEVRSGSEVGGPTFHLPVAKAGGLLAFGPAPLVLIRVVVGADAVVVHHPLHRRVQVERLRLVLRLEKQLLFAVAL